MDNIDVSLPEKYHVEPEGTAVGHTKVETHSEPDRDAIYLDYGPLLPDSYHQDIIVLLIRDPECVFCYWELSGTVVAAKLGNTIEPNLKWILRVQNISQKSFNDIAIPTLRCYDTERPASDSATAESRPNREGIGTPQNYSNPSNRAGIQGNYYLTVLPDTKYQSEFGVLTTDNRFISLVKSNTITTPRRNKAPITDSTSMSRIG